MTNDFLFTDSNKKLNHASSILEIFRDLCIWSHRWWVCVCACASWMAVWEMQWRWVRGWQQFIWQSINPSYSGQPVTVSVFTWVARSTIIVVHEFMAVNSFTDYKWTVAISEHRYNFIWMKFWKGVAFNRENIIYIFSLMFHICIVYFILRHSRYRKRPNFDTCKNSSKISITFKFDISCVTLHYFYISNDLWGWIIKNSGAIFFHCYLKNNKLSHQRITFIHIRICILDYNYSHTCSSYHISCERSNAV